jgi:hypothetical protein
MSERGSTIIFMARRFGYYAVAVLVAYGLASVFATQSVVASLGRMGVAVPPSDRLAMTLADLAGMANMFLPMVAFALLVAFMAAALLRHWLGRGRFLLYALAGAAAVVTTHLGLQAAFGITPVAAARSAGGLLLQALAGAAGGLAYIGCIRAPRRNASRTA